MEDEEILAAGAEAYLKTLILVSGDRYGEFDMEYGPEDASEETLSFVAGEVYAVMRIINRLTAKTRKHVLNPAKLLRSVCASLVWRAAAGVPATFEGTESFSSEDFKTVYAWYIDRLYEGKLVMYAGDDHKLYIDGFEWKRQVELRGWVTKGPECVLPFVYQTEAVSRSAAQLQHAWETEQSGWQVRHCKEHNNANLYTGARTCQGSLAEVG